MLLHQHPCGQRLGRVSFEDRHTGLAQNWPVIKGGGHLMHAAPMLGIARLKGARMGVQPFVFRQKRGVDIDHPTRPLVDKPTRQNPHKACKADHVGRKGFERLRNRGLKRHSVPSKGAMIHCDCRHTVLLRPRQSRCIRTIGQDDTRHALMPCPRHIIQQRHHVGAATRDEHRNPHHQTRLPS